MQQSVQIYSSDKIHAGTKLCQIKTKDISSGKSCVFENDHMTFVFCIFKNKALNDQIYRISQTAKNMHKGTFSSN